MNITLRNVKYAEFASEETSCFTATVYIDGEKAGQVSNDGKGGAHHWQPWGLEETVAKHAATLPPIDIGMTNDDGSKRLLDPTAECVIDDLLNTFLIERDFDRAIAKRVVMKNKDGRIVQTKTLNKAVLNILLADAPAKWPDAVAILNTMPRAEALAIYRAAA